MTSALKTYLKYKRGRARELAEALNVSESYLSNLASGHRRGSAEVIARIAELTGIEPAELLGIATNALHDDAEPFTPRAVPQGATLERYLAPRAQHRLTWRATHSAPMLGILAGDVLVVDLKRAPEPGETVIAALLDGDSTETRLMRFAPPWLIPADCSDAPVPMDQARVQGPVIAMARGPGLEPAPA